MFTVLYLPDNTTFHCITASTTIPATMYHQILDMHFYSNSYNNNNNNNNNNDNDNDNDNDDFHL